MSNLKMTKAEPLISEEESEAIRKQGAEAYAVNKLNARNPHTLLRKLEDGIREPFEVSEAKRSAWEQGYETEKNKS